SSARPRARRPARCWSNPTSCTRSWPASAPTMSEAGAVEPGVRVSTLELFFDLVFVFTITQLTAVLAGNLTWEWVGKTVLLMLIIWWMYDGFAWMTNTVAPTDPVRR